MLQTERSWQLNTFRSTCLPQTAQSFAIITQVSSLHPLLFGASASLLTLIFFCLGSFIVRFSLLFLPFSFFTPPLSFFLPLYVLFCGCDTHCLALLCSWFPSKHIDSPRSPTLPTHPSLSTPSFSPLSLAIAFVPLPGDTLQRVLHGGGQFYVSYGEPVPQHVGDSFFIPKGKPHAFDGQLHGPSLVLVQWSPPYHDNYIIPTTGCKGL